MATINILTPDVFNKIAAGEVVERPASVIKELVENSIDSGATFITIEILGGGIEKMVVTDNGCGIEKSELKKAFLPHATSKIKDARDIESILTLGFRGEALASIASVAKVCLTSRPKDASMGSQISVEGGVVSGESEVGAPCGTKMEVASLFYNVPARAKFLKKPKTEEQEITGVVSKFILANPYISFRYLADGKLVLETSGKGPQDALYSVYGKSALNETIELNYEQDGLKLFGFIGKPSFSKPNRTYQTLILNGRFINSYQVSASVQEAYQEKLMKRQYPFYCLYLTVPPDCVDVNVHPSKMEVRFSEASKIFNFVFSACYKAINGLDEVTKAYLEDSNKSIEKEANVAFALNDFKPQASVITETKQLDTIGFGNTDNINVDDSVSLISAITAINKDENDGLKDGFGMGSVLLESLNNMPQQNEQENMGIKPEIRKIGKFFNTYLLLEDSENLFIIDQHAAHERLMYEKFKKNLESGQLAIQPLLIPYILDLNASEIELFENNINAMEALGFSVEPFGKNSYKISTIPSIVSDINFEEFFANFLRETKRNQELTKLDLVKDEIMQLSCKSAVKGGWDLSESEIEGLYNSLSKEKVALFCPHGRPIVIRITKQEVEKWFKRIV